MATPLPPDTDGQIYVSVKPIIAGNAYLPLSIVFEDSIGEPKEAGDRVPVICFLITHPTKGRALFDLGIRKHGKGYPPHLDSVIFEYFEAQCEEDIAESLAKGGIKAEDIDHVILSHLHWDHCGDPAPFTSAKIVLGASAKVPLAEEVYPKNPTGGLIALPEGREIEFLDFTTSSAHPFGSFDHSIDYYGDGSLYIVDSPGHFSGHISAVARVAPNTFVFLAGDLCHHRQCYAPGTRVVNSENHRDIVTARDTIQRLAKLNREFDNIIVILAHERERLEVEKLPLFPDDIRDWAMKQAEKRG